MSKTLLADFACWIAMMQDPDRSSGMTRNPTLNPGDVPKLSRAALVYWGSHKYIIANTIIADR